MNIYHYIADTGIFYSEGVADESPLEPGVFLIPAHATTVAPPEATLPEIAVFRNEEWSVEVLPPPTPPVLLTPAEKLAQSGLTVAELKEPLEIDP
jgi:hypothetical protein